MRLGFLTNYSQERLLTAKVIGFDCLELQAASLPLGNDSRLEQVHQTCLQNNIGVAALACYQNHLEEGIEAERLKTFRQTIEAAPKLGCNVVATMSGCTQASQETGDITKSLPAFKKYFDEAVKIADDNGVKIAFENWPGGHPAPLRINIAFSPFAWDAMFDAVSSPALGLEFDPSHLVRLEIDYLPLIPRYAARIHHVHAKDTTVKTEVLDNVGYIGQGWWHYSIPSLGVVEWDALFAQLKGIGYNGDVNIEHEDPNYQSEKFDDGLRIGHQFLKQFTNE